MDSVNDIKTRIGAVEETKKITNAMKLVSSARIKKIVKSLEYNKIYFDRVIAAMKDILVTIGNESVDHPYFIGHDRKNLRKAYIIMAGDKGLAGAYNRNVLEFAMDILTKEKDPSIINVGNIARDYFRKHALNSSGYIMRFPLINTLNNARRITTAIKDLYDNEYVDEVYIIYTAYFGKHKNKPMMKQLLPIKAGGDLRLIGTEQKKEILYLPSEREAFDLLIPQYMIGIIFDTLVQAYANEQFARMTAMETSTQNADEILKKLRLQFNLARQSAITNEITEMSAATASMEMNEEDSLIDW